MGSKKEVQPFQFVAGRASKARLGRGGGETPPFQSFPGESGSSWRGKGDYSASHSAPCPSPPPLRLPARAFGSPRSRCPGQPPNFFSLRSFAARQSRGEPEELLGPRRGVVCVCLHLRVNTRCPPNPLQRPWAFLFRFYFSYFFFFILI